MEVIMHVRQSLHGKGLCEVNPVAGYVKWGVQTSQV